MSRTRSWIITGGFVLALLSLAEDGRAQLDLPSPAKASLLRFTVVPDGSARPPGDAVVASVLLYPGTERVDLELDLESVVPPAPGGVGAPTARPIRGEQGEKSPLPIRKEAVRGRDGGVSEVAFEIPSEWIRPSAQNALIRYTIRGSIGGETVFRAATALIPPPGRRPRSAIAADAPLPPVEVLALPGKNAVLAPPSKTLPAPRGPIRMAPAPVARTGEASFVVVRRRPVLFATNRTMKAETGTPSERFGDEVDRETDYGSSLVTIPADHHVEGQLELPGWLSGRDPDRSFLIEATDRMRFEAFRDLVTGRGVETRRDVLVYIHGFNTTFDFAVLRLAQVTHDIQFAGIPVVFSWPSHGSVLDYGGDERNAIASVEALAATLRTLVEGQKARPEALRGKVHLIAHSLGNRVTLRALERLDGELEAGDRPFGEVILAAPDVSVAEFSRRLPHARNRSGRVSLYFCPDDNALLASEIRHPDEPRAGRGVVPIERLDNIDARRVNTSFLGHGYWAEARPMLADLEMLVNLGWEPARRTLRGQPLKSPAGYRFWEFP